MNLTPVPAVARESTITTHVTTNAQSLYTSIGLHMKEEPVHMLMSGTTTTLGCVTIGCTTSTVVVKRSFSQAKSVKIPMLCNVHRTTRGLTPDANMTVSTSTITKVKCGGLSKTKHGKRSMGAVLIIQEQEQILE